MTNPFAMMTLHALHIFNLIHKTTALPKIVIYTAGTTLAATIIYKSMKHFLSYKKRRNRTPHQSQLPFEDKYFKEYDDWVSNTTTTNTAATATESNEEHKKECLENMYYATVRETINDFYGDIIMCYDHIFIRILCTNSKHPIQIFRNDFAKIYDRNKCSERNSCGYSK